MHECYRIRNIKENRKTCTNTTVAIAYQFAIATNAQFWECKESTALNKWTDLQSFVFSSLSFVVMCLLKWLTYFFPQFALLLFTFCASKCGHLFSRWFSVGCIYFLSVSCLHMRTPCVCVHFVWRKICASFPVDLAFGIAVLPLVSLLTVCDAAQHLKYITEKKFQFSVANRK